MSADVGALYEAHAPAVRAFVLKRMTGAAEPDAEDVAAQVWVRALRGAYRDDGKPLAWLYTIARHLITDYYRTKAWKERQRTTPVDSVLWREHPATDDRDPFEHDDVRAAVKRLHVKQQTAIVLRYMDRKSTREAAAMMGASEDGVKKLQARALVNLRRMLEAA